MTVSHAAPSTTSEPSQGPLRIFSALRHRNFRLYWFGMLVAVIGQHIQFVAQGWLVYELTKSPAALGLVGLAQAGPTVALNLFGGVVADRFDRRRLLIFTQSATALLVGIVAILVSLDLIQVWHIMVIAFLIGSVWAFDMPARAALVPHLVPREDLMNAVAMGSVVWQSSRIIGPSIAGILIATVGIAPCYFITTFAMLVMVGALAAVHIPRVIPTSQGSAFANLLEGLHYVWSQPIFLTLIGLTFFNSVFGMSYIALMPVFARDILEAGSEGYGYLMGMSGVGAVLGTLAVASLGQFKHKGWLILGGASAFGTLIALFAFSTWFPLSLALLFVLGVTQSLYMTTSMTTLQALVPDGLRGRVMGLFSLTYSLIPVGGTIGGAIASLAGAPVAVAIGGTTVAMMALVVARMVPAVRRLE